MMQADQFPVEWECICHVSLPKLQISAYNYATYAPTILRLMMCLTKLYITQNTMVSTPLQQLQGFFKGIYT